jgi:hypothetical protein
VISRRADEEGRIKERTGLRSHLSWDSSISAPVMAFSAADLNPKAEGISLSLSSTNTF